MEHKDGQPDESRAVALQTRLLYAQSEAPPTSAYCEFYDKTRARDYYIEYSIPDRDGTPMYEHEMEYGHGGLLRKMIELNDLYLLKRYLENIPIVYVSSTKCCLTTIPLERCK
jgi:hypothetical protein